MRTLSSRLFLSHGVLALLVALSLAVTLQGLLRMVGLIEVVRQEGFSGITIEEDLHRAAWAVELATRHGRARCELGHVSPAREGLAQGRAELGEVLTRASAAHASIRDLAHRYLRFADVLLTGDTCALLADDEVDRERAQLDEDLTNAWVDRLGDLHLDIREKEDEARRIGTTATALGFTIAAVAAIVAFLVARSTAASVNTPISELALAATRIGEGESEAIRVSRGPKEVQDLARDLERMRTRIQEIDALKQSFLANVSHELRTPLARLREAISLLSDGTAGETNPRQRRILDLAKRACDEEVRLVSSLLDLSRLRSGQPLKLEDRVSLSTVLDAALASEREGAARRQVEIRCAPAVRAVLTADASLLERAVANLLRNAASVSRAGDTVDVDVDTTAAEVVIRVRDRGPGVPEAVRARLFSPFASAPVPGTDRPLSMGLGLAFAREVARAHRGDLVLSSTDSGGTTFSLVLPITTEGT